ncbi:hypothetical protein RCO48_22890 [Peribacillus frigoritolerans]|nr:hypothetical protein [Peribacillus frigoritolerans]
MPIIHFPRLKVGGVTFTARHSLLALGLAGIAYLVSNKRKHQAVFKTASLMCKIERKEDSIKLIWPDEGGYYRVFRGARADLQRLGAEDGRSGVCLQEPSIRTR